MKIVIFYRDAFQPGGVPGEIQAIANALQVDHQVWLCGRTGRIPETLDAGVHQLSYTGFNTLGKILSQALQSIQPDIFLVVGFFIADNLIAAHIAKRQKISVVLNPLGQVTDEVLSGKIFTENPDIRQLEQTKLGLSKFKNNLSARANPLLKRIYLRTLGALLQHNTDYIAVFSAFEAEQFRKYLPTPPERFVTLRWGINAISEQGNPAHYYRQTLGYDDDKANYVYWGRLDWHYKGIDRLLKGVAHCAEIQGASTLPFRVFLIGPDYNGGLAQIQQFIETHQLESVVRLLLPGSYPAGSKTPLRDACASLYLSRWDGFPRTLRESTLLGVPVLVSQETHFAELVSAFESGLVANADDAQSVAQSLLRFTALKQEKTFITGAARLSAELTWGKITQSFLDELEIAFKTTLPERRTLP